MSLLLALLLAQPAAPARPAPPPVLTQSVPTRAVPTVPLYRLISNHDYPAAAIRAGEQGTVHVALDIAPEGRVTACTITASSGSAILDASTCRILRSRARFTPARDSAGKAVADRMETRIAWRMPVSPVQPALDAAMQAWLDCLKPTFGSRPPKTAAKTRAPAEKAFAGCRPSEDALLAVVAAAGTPPQPPEHYRPQLREQIIGMLEAARRREPR